MQTFQSTPSLRKATPIIMSALRGMAISIHTFLAEGDHFMLHSTRATSYFNPHLPCGRRQLLCRHVNRLIYFNPHLPCGRRRIKSASWDLVHGFQSTPSLRKATNRIYIVPIINYISIHTFLAEGDAALPSRGPVLAVFQSTPSLRKATYHSLYHSRYTAYFNPHLPCGRRPADCDR